ncbi:MAG: hypothetical protein VKK62_08700 [Synechococcaceae cyanobacterium]|nr:hypothetical protein [Synechococcaceae cyanobacterium]
MDHALRLRSLWVSWFLVMLFHTDLGLMPLFHGQSPEIESEVSSAQLPLLFASMMVYFLIPLAAYLLISWCASVGDPEAGTWRRWRRVHFWLSVVYTATNLPHLVADILIPDSRADQVVLMVVLTLIGLLINREAWMWWKRCPAVLPQS